MYAKSYILDRKIVVYKADEIDTYLSSIADVDDLAINMQTEYNKMTGDLLEKDVAVEMATKISDHIKGNK